MSQFYADCFLRAFPAVMREVPPVLSYSTPEQVSCDCYAMRSLEYFAAFLGLVEIDRDPAKRYSMEFRVRKLPLLDQVVQFHL